MCCGERGGAGVVNALRLTGFSYALKFIFRRPVEGATFFCCISILGCIFIYILVATYTGFLAD